MTDPAAPWASDRPLDADRVLQLVQAQFPALQARAARFLAEGWDSQVFRVEAAGGPWALRFPKRREVEPTLPIEAALLELIAPRLPLRVPRFELQGEPGAGFPYRFAGYRLLPGRPAAPSGSGAPADPLGAGRALGGFLRALHAVPVDDARRAGLGEHPRDPARMAARALEALPRAAAVVPAGPLELTRRALARVPAGPAGARAVVHNDLGPSHVLVDEAGRPCGVIDWSDAAVGDPASDFVGVLGWLGPAGLEVALQAWGGPVDADFLARVRFTTLAVGVLVASHAHARGDAAEAGDARALIAHALDL